MIAWLWFHIESMSFSNWSWTSWVTLQAFRIIANVEDEWKVNNEKIIVLVITLLFEEAYRNYFNFIDRSFHVWQVLVSSLSLFPHSSLMRKETIPFSDFVFRFLERIHFSWYLLNLYLHLSFDFLSNFRIRNALKRYFWNISRQFQKNNFESTK